MMVFGLICCDPWLYIVLLLKNKDMNIDRYESPKVEILKIEVEQGLLSSSFTGEGINNWEDM